MRTRKRANREKHGIGFDEVRELFDGDTDYFEIFDEEHSEVEERFIAIGPIRRGIVLVVWTEPGDDVIRIISARLATPHERELFHRHMEKRS
ncbi:MAG: BrnT family toxin [Lentisphaeria bacterium]|nr:BrnT family toxin [Lentisphaeria bacterium]